MVITSHHHQHHSHNTLSLHKSEVVSRQLPAPAQQYLSHSDHGTRVTVRNLFGNMPVRIKQRAMVFEKQGRVEWENLKSSVILLCLAWPINVALTLRDFATNQRMVIRGSSKFEPKTETSRVCRILSQSSFISVAEKSSWVSVGASTSSLDISGTICLDPSSTKHAQFISFNVQPIFDVEGQSILHDEINRCFLSSAFGNQEEAENLDDLEKRRRAGDARYKGGYTSKDVKRGKKSIDRWPMFYLDIQQTNSSRGSKSFNVDEVLNNKADSLSRVIGLLQALIFEFLTKHHFHPTVFRDQQLSISNMESQMPNLKQTSQLRARRTVRCTSSSSANGASSKSAKLEKERAPYSGTSNVDLLGTHVKLPSFRQTVSMGNSPFDTWSRIKSGTKKPALHNANDLAASKPRRSSTAPPASLTQVVRSNALPRSMPMISLTGNITRRPFDDIPVQPSPLDSASSQTFLASPSQKEAEISQRPPVPKAPTENDEDFVKWINPITKLESVVNKRTGHTVPIAIGKPLSQLQRTSSSPNLLARQMVSSSTSSPPPYPSSWLSALLDKWENPVFHTTESSISQVSLHKESEHIRHSHRHDCSQHDINQVFSEASFGIQGRISKQALRNAQVIGQVDRKFILVKLLSLETSIKDGKMLLVIDQHAADERIRVESLLAELCTPFVARSDETPNESGIVTTYLEKAIVFEVSQRDAELLERKKAYFAQWGICYDIPDMNQSLKSRQTAIGNRKGSKTFTVHSLPPGIVERCRSNPHLLLELIRREIYLDPKSSNPQSTKLTSEIDGKAWLERIHHCPQGILDMVNSRACRSAIMFNDVLSNDQCEALVRRLADTAFPFQCAHGRPSLMPLVGLGPLRQGLHEAEQGGDSFGNAFGKWKLSGIDE